MVRYKHRQDRWWGSPKKQGRRLATLIAPLGLDPKAAQRPEDGPQTVAGDSARHCST